MLELLKMFLPLGLLGMSFAGEAVAGDTATEPSTEKTEDEAEPGEGEKTPDESPEPNEEDLEKELLDKGDDIPFERFKKVVTQRNELRDKGSKSETLQAELEEIQGHPDVYRAILRSQGITDDNILDQRMKEAGFKIKEKELPENELVTQLTQGLDLKTKEGWIQAMLRAVDYGAKRHVAPLNDKFAATEREKFVSAQEKGAQELAKRFEIPYGVSGKDEGNVNTAVGKIAAYLGQHPDDAALGHVKLLKLALAEEGFIAAKKAGTQEEQDRMEDLKASAMEDSAHTSTAKMPSPDASIQEINRYSERHPEILG